MLERAGAARPQRNCETTCWLLSAAGTSNGLNRSGGIPAAATVWLPLRQIIYHFAAVGGKQSFQRDRIDGRREKTHGPVGEPSEKAAGTRSHQARDRILRVDFIIFRLSPEDRPSVIGINGHDGIAGAIRDFLDLHSLLAVKHRLGTYRNQIRRFDFARVLLSGAV